MRLIDADKLLGHEITMTDGWGNGHFAVMARYIVEAPTVESTALAPSDIADLRNEHCLLCGKYKTAHLGSCDGCRWRKDNV